MKSSTYNGMKNKLRIHSLEHISFEGLGCIKEWAVKKGHQLSYTHFYQNDKLPDLKEIDWLIVMGGPMSIHDEQKFPWLREEKKFIKSAIDAQKTVIGICLGSQLIAHVLGARVYKNPLTEIGWFDIVRTEESYPSDLLAGFEEKWKVLHWHGDTFEIPSKAVHLFQSEACKNQGFLFNQRVLGLQFHFEMTEQGLEKMFVNENEKLPVGVFVQSQEEILSQKKFIAGNNEKMFLILDRLDGNQF
ncbi:type 1 glutamine amidotransferase [Mariniphaga sediminis]|nr:type 1 glutamine amidotransferase [Mariniphaga sediminis]